MHNIICEKVFKTYYKIFPEDIELEPGETYESWISEMYEVDSLKMISNPRYTYRTDDLLNTFNYHKFIQHQPDTVYDYKN